MTSEPDEKTGRRPPTIELKATEIENPAAGHDNAGGPAAEGTRLPNRRRPKPQAKTPRRERGRMARARPSAPRSLLRLSPRSVPDFGLRALTPFTRGRLRLPPPRRRRHRSQRQPPLQPHRRQQHSMRFRRVSTKSSMRSRRRGPIPRWATVLTAAETQTKSLGDTLAALNRRVDGIAATSFERGKGKPMRPAPPPMPRRARP